MKLNVLFRRGVQCLFILTAVLTFQSCGFVKSKFGGGKADDNGVTNGEVTATARKGYRQNTPAGMVPIPSGSFIMGQTDEDMAATMSNMNKRVTISSFFMDDTEITNHEYRQFVNALLTDSISVLGEDIIMKEYYPDTTVWTSDFTFTNGDPMVEYYFRYPAFDTYPVVGVSWVAANYFSKWRSNLFNDFRAKEGLLPSPEFKLPSEAEWEWAARGGKAGAKYPWGNPYAVNSKGCYLANFKPQRGNYEADGYAYTGPANSYNPNDYGLYNMAGNVAEWTIDSYADNAYAITYDMNPAHTNPNEPRKVVKGGSWKDIAYFLQCGTRSYEYQDKKRAYIGFRNVMLNIEGRRVGSSR